jgi:hypothetical protein
VIQEVVKSSNAAIRGGEFVTRQDKIYISENLEKTGLRVFKVRPAQNNEYLI